jgi:hypothetical protein
VEVLRRVNGRGFAAGLGQTLPDAMFLVDEADVVSRLAHPPSVGTAWRVKHAHGMAGRNQRVVAPGGGSPDDLRFVRRGLAAGGVQLEPQVSIEAEYALHGFVAGDGAVRTGALVRQRCDARGAWLATEPVDAAEGAGVLAGVRDRMGGEVTRVAAALVAAGYAGPFGVDGYLYRGREGALCLQPRSEINARYSMGYAIGFGRRA